jgi:ABC-type transporter Mla MlaB component
MRVTIHQLEGEIITLKVEGQIAGLRVPELHRAWQELTPSLRQKKLRVDLRGVTHVDGAGRSLLAEIHARTGANFLADTPLTKYFAEEAQQSMQETIPNANHDLRRQR